MRVLNKVLDADPPDLVVMNGDLITGENGFLENSTVYIDMMMQPLLKRNLPWASTYGNHDYQYNLSAEAILKREHQWPNSRTQQMVHSRDAGVSNYYLPVYPHNCKQKPCGPSLILWFFDSRGGHYYQRKDAKGELMEQPNWVDYSVVNWFQQTHVELLNKYQRAIPSLAFVHIPTAASLAFQQHIGPDPNRQPGINDDNPLAAQAQDWCADGVTRDGSCEYGGLDTPFMQALSSTPGLMALFSGHDHGATWCYRWDTLLPSMTVKGNGLNLCFGQHSGYGGYGRWPRGARQVFVTEVGLEKLEVETWVRLESGERIGAVSLNATYNQDVYPLVPDLRTLSDHKNTSRSWRWSGSNNWH